MIQLSYCEDGARAGNRRSYQYFLNSCCGLEKTSHRADCISCWKRCMAHKHDPPPPNPNFALLDTPVGARKRRCKSLYRTAPIANFQRLAVSFHSSRGRGHEPRTQPFFPRGKPPWQHPQSSRLALRSHPATVPYASSLSLCLLRTTNSPSSPKSFVCISIPFSTP